MAQEQKVAERLDDIVRRAPAPQPGKDSPSGWAIAQKTASSQGGIALATFVLVFLLLLGLQPAFIFSKNAEGEHSLKHINYVTVLIVAAVCAALVFILPYLIAK
jgi:hypothetical protein